MSVLVTCRDAEDLAATVARRLQGAVRDHEESGAEDPLQLCLTGGRIATEVYRHLADAEAGEQLADWSRVEFWWGDERFVPTESPDRNAGQTLALLAATIQLDPARVHPMPAGGGSIDLTTAAQQYATELGSTTFDICLLGIGEDGHVASVFPDHPSFLKAAPSRVISVADSPKPPSERLTLTIPTINESTEVWLIVSGSAKAEAAARAFNRDLELPAGSVQGTQRTVWFCDRDATQLMSQ